MDTEITKPSQLIVALIDAAKDQNWEKVDEDLVPQLPGLDGNQATKELLIHVKDENPDIRDVVATSLSALIISDDDIKGKATEAMKEMATTDSDIFPSGRAAVYLIKIGEEREDVKKALDVFKQRAISQNWQKELEENIPDLKNFF